MTIHPKLLCRLFLVVACSWQPVQGAAHWISVTTSHFEMYTTNGEKQAVRALQGFEQVRSFFLQNSRNKFAPEGRVRIVAFSSEQEYKPYRMNGGSFAYYQQSHERDYIVMQDIEPDHHQAAVHEYTHLIVQHMKIEIPIWLNEGMADLYSSLEPKGQQAMVGRPLEYHLMTLNSRPWMNWNALFGVEHDSPYYNEKDKMAIFYAQSWMLTHMLALGKDYGPQFSNFLLAEGSGMSTPEALQKVYGKTVDQVAKDAQNYAKQTSMRAAVFNISLQKADLDPQVTHLSNFEVDLACADLLAARRETAGEAQSRLTSLEQQNPQSSEVEESLGYLAWQENQTESARKHFGLAIQRGSKNAKMIYDYATLQRAGSAPLPTVIELAKKVLALKPDDVDAKIFLADLHNSAGQYSSAVGVLSELHTLTPEQAFSFYVVKAYSHANLRDFEGAKGAAQKALQYAKKSDQRAQVEGLLRSLDEQKQGGMVAASASADIDAPAGSATSQVERGVPSLLKRDEGRSRVQGKTKLFECGHGWFRLHLEVADHEMVFEISNPQDIVVKNLKDLQWSCGPLTPQDVTVIYTPATSSKVDGAVEELVF